MPNYSREHVFDRKDQMAKHIDYGRIDSFIFNFVLLFLQVCQSYKQKVQDGGNSNQSDE